MIEDEVRTLLEREPFEPFRITLINGDRHDVLYPAMVAVLEEGLFMTLQGGHWAQFPFDRVASFESLLGDFAAGPPE